MSWHCLAHSTTIATVAETAHVPVPDSVFTVQNARFLPQRNYGLLFAYMNGLLVNQCRISSPSIRQFSPAQVRPIDLAALPVTRPGVADYRNNPLLLKALEEISVTSINSAATSGVYHSLLGVSDGAMIPVPGGDIFTIRGTAATTLTVEQWSLLAVTWADTLPAGRYACVGLHAVSTGAVGARCIFEDQVLRPGSIGFALESAIPHPMFLKGGLGVWGYFTGNRMPNVEVLSISADTAETVYLEFIRVG